MTGRLCHQKVIIIDALRVFDTLKPSFERLDGLLAFLPGCILISQRQLGSR